jgi:hypothetical protein
VVEGSVLTDDNDHVFDRRSGLGAGSWFLAGIGQGSTHGELEKRNGREPDA